MKDVLNITKDRVYFNDDLHEKLYNYLLTGADRNKLETQNHIQVLVHFYKITPLKTLKQLGYLHAEVYFKAWLSYMITQGTKLSEDEAIYELKKACGFIYSNGCPKSMATATVDEASAFIKRAVVFINEDMGVVKCDKSKEDWENKPIKEQK